MRFTFEIANQVQFDRAFNRVGEHIKDLRPVWPAVERKFYQIESEQFKSEGAKGRSGKWAPLERKYAKQKAQRHGVQPILRATGRLEQSLTGNTSDSILIKENQEFGIGTNLFYADYHQTGTSKMPQREVISFSDNTRTDLTKEIQKELLKIIKADRTVTQSINVE